MNSPGGGAACAFVGRERELAALRAAFDEARAGRGRVIMLVGEPGIGKTRTAEQFAAIAREQGALVLRGGCHEGEWAPPYGPFAEAITEYARGAAADHLRLDLGFGSGAIARIVPALQERLPDIPEPAALQPDEERFRLLDAVCQFLIATSLRAPVLLVLDDFNWADCGTIAMLRHVARFAPRHRMLLLATYRDGELDREPPLVEALALLRRETSYERIHLKSLSTPEVGTLLAMLAGHDVPRDLAAAITAETGGNPFFIREVLLHLVEEGKLHQQQGRWTASVGTGQMGIPESVRQVIARRLSRLAEQTNGFLTVAAAFNGVFRFDIATAVAGLDEAEGLSAVEEALGAQMLCPGSAPDTYAFTHALIRHTLYAAVCPSRQLRLHRQIAETMERMHGDRVLEHAAEVAYQYHHSAVLPGGERVIDYALIAVNQAEAAYAWEQVVAYLRTVLAALGPEDPRHPRVLARLGLALPWVLAFEEAVQVAGEAARLLAETEGPDAAADYLGDATAALGPAGSLPSAMQLAQLGMRYIGDRRDLTWLRLASNDLQRREQERPDYPGLLLDSPERRELSERAASLPLEDRRGIVNVFPPLASRAEALRDWAAFPVVQTLWAGDFRQVLPRWEQRAASDEREGRIDAAATWLAYVARCRLALGELTRAHDAHERAAALAARLPEIGNAHNHLTFYSYERCMALDDGWAEHAAATADLAARLSGWNLVYAAAMRARDAVIYARLGQAQRALELLAVLAEPLDRAPAWSPHYTAMACGAATSSWLLECTDHADVIERNLRAKVVAPDFRYPMCDGRLSIARLCALQERYEKASEWFANARTVLDQQGARPLRAIVDHDEAVTYLRRGTPGDNERAAALLALALQQFRALDMTGWITRAEALRETSSRSSPEKPPSQSLVGERPPKTLFVREGEYWTIAFAGRVARLKDAKGLHYIAHLLRHPGRELHVSELVATVGRAGAGPCPDAVPVAAEWSALARVTNPSHDLGMTAMRGLGDAGPLLDATAKAAYKTRLDDLREELMEAERFNDPGRVHRARAEIEMISQQLSAAVGLGGRDRLAASDAERARLAVTKRIKAALTKIGDASPALAHHLGAAISTGYFCSYSPKSDAATDWSLE